MKRKLLSFIMAFMMVLSLIPVNTALAATGDSVDTTEEEKTDLEKGKDYVTEILKSAKTTDDYKYSSTLVKDVDGLSELLKNISDEDKNSLNDFVAEQTLNTEEGTSVYDTVTDFSAAYSAKQSEVLADLLTKAKNLLDSIQNFLDNEFNKETYQVVLEQFNDEEVKAYYQDSEMDQDNELNHFANIIDLMESVEKAEAAINEIPALTSETIYQRSFKSAMTKAQNAFEVASGKYEILQNTSYYNLCLPVNDNGVGALIDNYAKYDESELKSKIEDAYHGVGSFSKMTESIKANIKELVDAVKESEQNINVNVRTMYNGKEILDLIDKYNKIVDFEERSDALSKNITSTTEVAQAMQVYESYFEKLDEATQKMIPDEYLTQIQEALTITTGSENIQQEIDEIGVVESEENFSEVSARLEKAYADYRTFLTRYAGVRGIADMITNADILDDETIVVALIKSIDQITKAGDMTLSANSAQLESVKYAYDNLKGSLKPQIYNIEALNEVYEDALNANKVIGMIAGIQNNFTLEDQEYINNVREAYNALSNNAKIYVGSSRIEALTKADEQLYALNNNVASRTSALISQIGKVTASSKELIGKARTSYNSLNAIQKQMVTNYSVLTAAEEAYKKLDTTLDKAAVTGLGTYTYSGNAIKPPVTVKLNDVLLVEDIDYSVVYSSNVDAGKAKIVLTGKGDYSGTITKTFKIKPISILIADVSGYKTSYNYKRKAITPSVTVKFSGVKLEENTDYTVKYVSNKNAGTAKIKVIGKGNYTGTITNTFKIKKISLKKAKFGSFQKRFYRTGKLIKPTLTIKWKGKKLKQGRDYVITYSNNRWVGTASMKITGTGNFKGSKKYNFTIY